jgi:quinol-cytochrome oxidoreductase complex cytochrome b subunit
MNTQENLKKEQVKTELMRYRKNNISYIFGLIALLFSVTASFIGLNSLAYNYSSLIKILLNIAILLFGFLFSEQAKAYSKKGSLGLIFLGLICLLRILWAPRILLFGSSLDWGEVLNPKNLNINWLPQSPTLRGWMTLILLTFAASSFITSGVIGYKKANKLINYMEYKEE